MQNALVAAAEKPERARATLIGLIAILLWATLAPLTVFAAGVPPFELLTLSFGVAFLAGIGLLAVRGREALSQLRQPLAPWLSAFTGIFGYHALYFYALSAAPAAEASLINYLWPLLIVLMAGLMPGERLLARHFAGALLGLGGTALIVLSGKDATGASAAFSGYAAALGCAFVWAAYSVFNHRFDTVPGAMIIGVCGAVAAAGAVFHLLLENAVTPDNWQWLGIILMGIGPVGVAFLAWDYATKHGRLAVLGALSYLSPLLSTGLLVVIGNAPASLRLVAAALLITGGAVLAAGFGRREADTPRHSDRLHGG